jgi:L-ascorbate metabolism protein UlaG (beta-lactamase superfamily)
MKTMHINPAEAVKVFKDIRAKRAIGIHWGTFQLTDEGPMEPPVALKKALHSNNLGAELFQAVPIGSTF